MRRTTPDILALNGASVAVNISEMPFPVRSARCVGKIDGALVINPTISQMDESVMSLTVAGTTDSIVMVEGGARHLPEAEILEALQFAHGWIVKICALQDEIIKSVGKKKIEVVKKLASPELEADVKKRYGARIHEANKIQDKEGRENGISEIKKAALAELAESYAG